MILWGELRRAAPRRRNVAVFVLVIACIAGGAAFATSATAATPVPEFGASLHGQTMYVTWKTSSRSPSKTRVVEVQRQDGTSWTTVFKKAKAGSKGTFKDTAAAATRYVTYRGRVTEAEHTSAWSTPIAVDTYPALEAGAVPCPADYEARGVAALNKWRAANGTDASQRAPMTTEIHLARLATLRASHQAHIQKLTHASFSIGLLAKWGYPLARDGGAAENALVIGNPEQAIAGWAGSPPHRQNMLRRALDVGFGCAVDTKRGFAWYTLILGAAIISSG